jgi:hypothetical protein
MPLWRGNTVAENAHCATALYQFPLVWFSQYDLPLLHLKARRVNPCVHNAEIFNFRFIYFDEGVIKGPPRLSLNKYKLQEKSVVA